MTPRVVIGLKFLGQFGLRPLVWYASYRLGLKTGYYRWKSVGGPAVDHLVSSRLFSLPSREKFAEILTNEVRQDLLKEAQEIVEGGMRVFGGKAVPIQFNLGQRLSHWTEYETRKVPIPESPLGHSDIKFLWEPARFGWSFTLGRAYHLSGDDRYAQAFWNHVEAFTTFNPPDMGPHWMNGQEAAMRMIALVWAAHVFEGAASTTEERGSKLVECIHAHADRISRTLTYARSQNNNHLLTEAAALYTAGLFLHHWRWRSLGWKWLNWSFQKQVGGYGEYIQHSTNYHRLMLQTALWVNLIKQDVFPAGTSQALARAAHWLFSLLDNESGRTPNLGSNDGALILPLSGAAFADFRPTIQAAARAFLRNNLPPGVWDETSLWLGLQATTRITDSNAYLMDNLRAQHSWGYLRASNFKSRLAHMDQLHFDLWWRGLNIAQDAGSYLYNADPPWDNSLVTTRVHNTVTIDGRDQMTRGGRFLVLDWASAFARLVIETDENILHRLKAYFTGYRDLGVRHERTVTVYRNETWVVEDRLVSRTRRPRTYRLHWLLIDGEWNIHTDDHGAVIQIMTPPGPVKLVIRHSSSTAGQVSLVRAGELVRGERSVQPYEGWVSRNYGEKAPALSLALEITSPYHTVITSEFTFPR